GRADGAGGCRGRGERNGRAASDSPPPAPMRRPAPPAILTFVVDERPYRVPPPDARRLGWTETRIGRATELTRDRRSAETARDLAPLVVGSGALALAFATISPLTQALSAALAAGVVATWPRSTERIRIDERGLVWRDRLLG